MMIRAASLLACATLLTACAGLGAPSSTDIQRLPVVRYGQAAPADRDFVLLYPAGADLPVNVQVDGSLLAKSDQAKLIVRVKRDVFVYRDQVSFDGKIWKRGQDCIGGNIVFSLPGDVPGSNGQARDGVSPGVLAARFDLRGEAAGK